MSKNKTRKRTRNRVRWEPFALRVLRVIDLSREEQAVMDDICSMVLRCRPTDEELVAVDCEADRLWNRREELAARGAGEDMLRRYDEEINALDCALTAGKQLRGAGA